MNAQKQSRALLFDGYCPESKLQGKTVQMRLNEDDFWESEATGLQITTFAPYAVILKWRGKGKFKLHNQVASHSYDSLLLTASSEEAGKEILPDINKVIPDQAHLELYLCYICKTKEIYEKRKQFLPDSTAEGFDLLGIRQKILSAVISEIAKKRLEVTLKQIEQRIDELMPLPPFDIDEEYARELEEINREFKDLL